MLRRLVFGVLPILVLLIVALPLPAREEGPQHAVYRHEATSLVWQRTDDGKARTWPEAKRYCENLTLGGQSDWRLPTLKELRSAYRIKSELGMRPVGYWSSGVNANGGYKVWYLSFKSGVEYWNGKTNRCHVRCVVRKGDGSSPAKALDSTSSRKD